MAGAPKASAFAWVIFGFAAGSALGLALLTGAGLFTAPTPLSKPPPARQAPAPASDAPALQATAVDPGWTWTVPPSGAPPASPGAPVAEADPAAAATPPPAPSAPSAPAPVLRQASARADAIDDDAAAVGMTSRARR